jgi:hypothetical protein
MRPTLRGVSQRGSEAEKERNMKYAGLLVMPAGFFLCIAAILLFPASASRNAFVVCGLAVEAMGLVVAVRGHMSGERR